MGGIVKKPGRKLNSAATSSTATARACEPIAKSTIALRFSAAAIWRRPSPVVTDISPLLPKPRADHREFAAAGKAWRAPDRARAAPVRHGGAAKRSLECHSGLVGGIAAVEHPLQRRPF